MTKKLPHTIYQYIVTPFQKANTAMFLPRSWMCHPKSTKAGQQQQDRSRRSSTGTFEARGFQTSQPPSYFYSPKESSATATAFATAKAANIAAAAAAAETASTRTDSPPANSEVPDWRSSNNDAPTPGSGGKKGFGAFLKVIAGGGRGRQERTSNIGRRSQSVDGSRSPNLRHSSSSLPPSHGGRCGASMRATTRSTGEVAYHGMGSLGAHSVSCGSIHSAASQDNRACSVRSGASSFSKTDLKRNGPWKKAWRRVTGTNTLKKEGEADLGGGSEIATATWVNEDSGASPPQECLEMMTQLGPNAMPQRAPELMRGNRQRGIKPGSEKIEASWTTATTMAYSTDVSLRESSRSAGDAQDEESFSQDNSDRKVTFDDVLRFSEHIVRSPMGSSASDDSDEDQPIKDSEDDRAPSIVDSLLSPLSFVDGTNENPWSVNPKQLVRRTSTIDILPVTPPKSWSGRYGNAHTFGPGTNLSRRPANVKEQQEPRESPSRRCTTITTETALKSKLKRRGSCLELRTTGNASATSNADGGGAATAEPNLHTQLRRRASSGGNMLVTSTEAPTGWKARYAVTGTAGARKLIRRAPSDEEGIQLPLPALASTGFARYVPTASGVATAERLKVSQLFDTEPFVTPRKISSMPPPLTHEGARFVAGMVQIGTSGEEEVAMAVATAAALWATGGFSPSLNMASRRPSRRMLDWDAPGEAQSRSVSKRAEEANAAEAQPTPILQLQMAPAQLVNTSRPPAAINVYKDMLERMHHLLTSTFALVDTEDFKSGNSQARSQAAASARRLSSLSSPVAPAMPPTVWVTRFVDRSKKYGLGFQLSDGSIGVRFNDLSKIVMDPGGDTFEYVKRASSNGRPSREAGSPTRKKQGHQQQRLPLRTTHSLDNPPPYLQKKVKLFGHFRKEIIGKGKAVGGSGIAKESGAAKKQLSEVWDGNKASGSSAIVVGRRSEEPSAVVEHWRRTRTSCLFLMNNLTAQVN